MCFALFVSRARFSSSRLQGAGLVMQHHTATRARDRPDVHRLVVHALLQSSSPTFDRLLHPNVRTTIQVNIHLGFLAHLHIFALHVLDKEHLKQQIFNT